MTAELALADDRPAAALAAVPAPRSPDELLATRVAVLEERTLPKHKTRLERIKDWGGIASLALTLAYSFPLGVWDRFIEPDKKRAAEELVRLRDVVEQSVVIISEGGKALAGIQDPFLYDTVGRAVNTRLFVLMSKHRELFEKHKELLTPPELLVIGNTFAFVNLPDAARPFFVRAHERAGQDVQSKVEAIRQLAKGLFAQGPSRDQTQARGLFQQALQTLVTTRSQQAMYSHAALQAEWALMELIDGDWQCGQDKLQLAQAELATLAPFLNDQGNFARLVDQRTRALTPRPGQPRVGC